MSTTTLQRHRVSPATARATGVIGDLWVLMITFLDDYRKQLVLTRRPRGAYLDPTSDAEERLAERWAIAERLMRLFDLSWNQAIGVAGRMVDAREPESFPEGSGVDPGLDGQGPPPCSRALGGR